MEKFIVAVIFGFLLTGHPALFAAAQEKEVQRVFHTQTEDGGVIPQVIICDAHGVLVEFSPMVLLAKMVCEILPDTTLGDIKGLGHPVVNLNTFFTQKCPLQMCSGECLFMPGMQDFIAKTKGENLAHALVAWKKGEYSSEDALAHVENYLGESEELADVVLLVLARILFDNELCQTVHKNNKQMCKVVTDMKEKNNDLQLYLFSNALPVWLSGIQELLDAHFTKCYHACEYHMIKPNPAFLRHLLRSSGIDPATCLIIDDKKEVCEMAHEMGMQAFWYKNDDQVHEQLCSFLIRLGLLDIPRF